MMHKSMQLIKSYTLNCSRFLMVKGDRALAAWIQFGMQETRRIINKFPSVSSYIHNMTDPDQPDNTENDIEDNIASYRIRFLNNMKVTTPHMAIRMQYQRIYLEQAGRPTTPQPSGVIFEIGHNRRRNLDLDPNKIELINTQTRFLRNRTQPPAHTTANTYTSRKDLAL